MAREFFREDKNKVSKERKESMRRVMRFSWMCILALIPFVLSGLVIVVASRYAGPSTNVIWGFWEVLVGAIGLALAIIAVILALAGVLIFFVGKDWINERIDRAVKATREETSAMLRHYVGYIFGELYRELEKKPSPFINYCLDYERRAYKGLPDENPNKINALNNIAFYSSIRGYHADGPTAKEIAETLLDDYKRSGDIDWLTTYASVVAKYSKFFDNPGQALLDGKEIMEELIKREDVSEYDKNNARRHLEKIVEALKPPR